MHCLYVSFFIEGRGQEDAMQWVTFFIFSFLVLNTDLLMHDKGVLTNHP